MLPLHTPRLSLRRFCAADVTPFMGYRSDLDVARYQGWEGCSPDEAAAFVERHAVQEAGVPGQWLQVAIALRVSNQLIGDCGFKVHANDPRQATFGVTLARAWQGQGFATEAVSALFDRLFTSMKLHRIIADTDPENARSWRLLERLGMRREAHTRKSLWFKGGWADEYLYAVLAGEWAAIRRRA